jgi:hypothetical protein
MKQINLFTPFWKEALKYLGWVLLFVVLWFNGCSRSAPTPQTAKVIVPEVKGKFEAKKPVHEPILNKPNSTQLKISTEPQSLSTEPSPLVQKLIEENKKLAQDFAKANDSIKKLLFDKAVQLNKFSTDFEDENLTLNINGVVQGEVKEITPNYTIKKKTISVPVKQKETVFRVLAGGAVGLNKDLNQAAYKLDLNFQNRKGDIISGEFLRVGDQSFGMVGFKKSIINIKR